MRVSKLTPRQCQLVEIHRVLIQQAHLLILDEPTATLSPQESKHLFLDLMSLAEKGFTVVVVSHRLGELVGRCDRFTVLRNGKVTAQISRRKATVERLLDALEGNDSFNRSSKSDFKQHLSKDNEATLVSFHKVALTRHKPRKRVNFKLYRGEIVGIVGRPGSGTKKVLKILRRPFIPLSRGVEWHPLSKQDSDQFRIGYVPYDRWFHGLIPAMTIGENLLLRRRKLLGLFLSRKQHRERDQFVSNTINHFEIRPPNPERFAGALSGGNAQKLLIAREIDYANGLLLLESPTAGLNMSAAAFVVRKLRAKSKQGTCVVVLSDDLDEIVQLADRVLVFGSGRLVAELSGSEITTHTVGLALLTPEATLDFDVEGELDKAVETCAS